MNSPVVQVTHSVIIEGSIIIATPYLQGCGRVMAEGYQYPYLSSQGPPGKGSRVIEFSQVLVETDEVHSGARSDIRPDDSLLQEGIICGQKQGQLLNGVAYYGRNGRTIALLIELARILLIIVVIPYAQSHAKLVIQWISQSGCKSFIGWVGY